MKAMIRRLRRIEAHLAPKPNTVSQRAAQLLWERRRRRADANGQPFEEPPPHTRTAPPGGYLSVAETLRRRRQLCPTGPESALK
jgi:hypothetical protein